MAPTRIDYTAEKIAAARSVLLELCRLLGAYREDIVVVGGWVPELLPNLEGDHVGTIDVDLALNHRTLQEAGYRTIAELLVEREYVRDEQQPFIYRRKVAVEGRAVEVEVEVDFLAGEYGGTGKSRRTQRVQGVQPRKARGCDLAFALPVVEVVLQGVLPGGGQDSARVRIASIVPFLVMKGMALNDRLKEKDAWDVYFCLRHYPGSFDALVAEFKPHMVHGLVREGLAHIARSFASLESVGPVWAASFDPVLDEEDRAIIRRDAFERASELLRRLGTIP